MAETHQRRDGGTRIFDVGSLETWVFGETLRDLEQMLGSKSGWWGGGGGLRNTSSYFITVWAISQEIMYESNANYADRREKMSDCGAAEQVKQAPSGRERLITQRNTR